VDPTTTPTESTDTGTAAFITTPTGIGTVTGASAVGVGGAATAFYYANKARQMVKAPVAATGAFNI